MGESHAFSPKKEKKACRKRKEKVQPRVVIPLNARGATRK
jgi:hypothetical protein